MAGTTGTSQGWRERWAHRENMRRQHAHEAALSEWRRADGELRQMLAAAREFHGLAPGRIPSSITPRRGEAVLWTAPAAGMIEVKEPVRLTNPGYEQFALAQVTGVFSAPPPPQAKVVDNGSAAVTSQRVIFQGSGRDREWAFAKLVGVGHDAAAPCTLLQVANRKRVSGLVLDPAAVPGFRFNLALGLADAADDRAGFVAHLERLLDGQQRLMPQPPALVTPQEAPHPARVGLGIVKKIYLGPPGASAGRRIGQSAVAVLATLVLIGIVAGPLTEPGASLNGVTSAETGANSASESPSSATTAPPSTTPPSSTPAAAPTPPPQPKIEKKTVVVTQVIPFTRTTVRDASLDKGTKVVTTRGVNGVKRLTYELTLTDGVETGRRLLRAVVTTRMIPRVTSIGTKVEPQPAARCDPNYSGACVPIASDVDCEGGTGNGPAYVSGPVRVVRTDIYGLDDDDDGTGCEN